MTMKSEIRIYKTLVGSLLTYSAKARADTSKITSPNNMNIKTPLNNRSDP